MISPAESHSARKRIIKTEPEKAILPGGISLKV